MIPRSSIFLRRNGLLISSTSLIEILLRISEEDVHAFDQIRSHLFGGYAKAGVKVRENVK